MTRMVTLAPQCREPMRTLKLVVLACFCLMWPGICTAQDISQQQKLAVRGPLPLGDIVWLTVFSQSQKYKVSSHGQTALEVVQSVCGDGHEDAAYAVILNEVSKLNKITPLEPSTRLVANQTIEVPFCPKVFKNAKAVARAGETVESVLARENPYAGTDILPQLVKLNPGICSLREGQCNRKLKEGEQLMLPAKSVWTTGVLRPGFEPTFAVVGPSDMARSTEAVFRKVAFIEERSGATVDNSVKANYIAPLADGDVKEGNNCATPTGRPWPVDLAGIEERLRRAESLLPTKLGKPRGVGTVAVFDNGMSETLYLSDVFPKKLFKKEDATSSPAPASNIASFNADFEHDIVELTPLAADPYEGHGTSVTSLVFGGPDFQKVLVDRKEPPPIEVAIVRLSKEVAGTVWVETASLPRALEWAQKDQKVDVINLSLEHSSVLHRLYQSFTKDGAILLVAAAGNRGVDVNTEDKLPAKLGWQRSSQPVLVVAGHDVDGRPVLRSNHSNQYVDIFAPGCGVPTYAKNGSRVARHGTSFAAPLVSFTAALLRAVGLQTAEELRNRIMIGSDFDDKLGGVWSSGRLNTPKALSVFDDVVQLREPIKDWKETGAMAFGKIHHEPNELLQFCNDPEIMKKVGSSKAVIRKASVYVDAGNHFMVRYMIQTGTALWSEKCPLRPGNLNFQEAGADRRSVPIHSVGDIVFRWR
jgi:hypothetical protein